MASLTSHGTIFKKSPVLSVALSSPNRLNKYAGFFIVPIHFFCFLSFPFFSFLSSRLHDSLCYRHVVEYADRIGQSTLLRRLYFATKVESITVNFIVTRFPILDFYEHTVSGGGINFRAKNTGTYNFDTRTIKSKGDSVDASSTVMFNHNAHMSCIAKAGGVGIKPLFTTPTLLKLNIVHDCSSLPRVVKVGLYNITKGRIAVPFDILPRIHLNSLLSRLSVVALSNGVRLCRLLIIQTKSLVLLPARVDAI